MTPLQIAGWFMVAFAFAAAAGQDVVFEDRAAATSPCPIPSDGASDAGEEAALPSSFDLAALIPLESRRPADDPGVVPSPLVVRRIPHVPKPVLSV